MNAFHTFLTWLAKHRRTIFTTLVFILLIQICSGPKDNNIPKEPQTAAYQQPPDANQLKSYEQLEQEQIKKYSEQQSPALYTYLLMVALVLIIFLIQRKNLLRYLIPQRVAVSSSLIRNQSQYLIKLRLVNSTRQTVEFNQPMLVFSNLKRSRSFKLSNEDFPLMLSPDTGHAITFSINKLSDAIPELREFPFVHMEINTTGGKNHKTLPRWIRWK
ncbi:MAG: hypothetical protein ACWA6U_12720 [Breznakibacter sp.]